MEKEVKHINLNKIERKEIETLFELGLEKFLSAEFLSNALLHKSDSYLIPKIFNLSNYFHCTSLCSPESKIRKPLGEVFYYPGTAVISQLLAAVQVSPKKLTH